EADPLREEAGDRHVSPRHGPEQSAWREQRQRRGQGVRFVSSKADAVGCKQRWPVGWLGETRQDEAAGLVHRKASLLFAERVVIEARQHMALLDRCSEAFEEAMLRPVMHDEIR